MKKELVMAVQQFTGYAHAAKGYGVEDLIKSMALTKREFDAIRDDLEAFMPASDFDYAVAYFETVNL